MCGKPSDKKLRKLRCVAFAALPPDEQLKYESDLKDWFTATLGADEAKRASSVLRNRLFGTKSERQSAPVQEPANRRQRDSRLLYGWLLRQARPIFWTTCGDVRRRQI